MDVSESSKNAEQQEEAESSMNAEERQQKKAQVDVPESSKNAEERALLQSMEKELEKWRKPNDFEDFIIFRTPNNIRESKKNLLGPSVVTIGPLNHGDRRYSTMENIKWQSLSNFLSSRNRINLNADMIQRMEDLEERTRKCYGEVTEQISSPDFVRMMVVDGCFVLDCFTQMLSEELFNFKAGWNSEFIYTDLLLLENQLPYFVIEELGKISGVKDMKIKLRKHFAKGLGQNVLDEALPSEIHHLVHLHYHSIVPSSPKIRDSDSRPSVCHGVKGTIKYILMGLSILAVKRLCCFNMSTNENSTMVIPCATELKEAGVQFHCRAPGDSNHMLDISFNNGVLTIPKIEISDEFLPLFMNLLAFEQCHLHILNSHLASFARFLDSLVNTKEDVMILQKCGVIENLLSSEEELTSFFNQISRDVLLDKEHL